jgi:hypothetical protein
VLLAVAVLTLAAGCSDGGSPPQAASRTEAPAQTTLTIRIRTFAGDVLETSTLGCSPPAGTKADPPAACTALRDYVSHFHLTGFVCGCAVPAAATRYAVISGTLDGKRLQARLLPCMCELPWRMLRDLRIATGLTSFSPETGRGLAAK